MQKIVTLQDGRTISWDDSAEILDLSNLGLTDDNLIEINSKIFSQPNKIKEVNLYRNNLTDASAELLTSHGFPSLQLCYNNFTEIGLEILLLSESIQSLDLSRNNLGDGVLQVLQKHSSLPQLKFEDNPVQDNIKEQITMLVDTLSKKTRETPRSKSPRFF
jgi:Leucine-rich repeat (LRR) protein